MFRMLVVLAAGWLRQNDVLVVAYLREENRVLREQVGDRHLRFSKSSGAGLPCARMPWAVGCVESADERPGDAGAAAVEEPEPERLCGEVCRVDPSSRVLERLNRLIPLGEPHLRELVREYVAHSPGATEPRAGQSGDRGGAAAACQ